MGKVETIKNGWGLYTKVGDDDNAAGIVGAMEDVLR